MESNQDEVDFVIRFGRNISLFLGYMELLAADLAGNTFPGLEKKHTRIFFLFDCLKIMQNTAFYAYAPI